MALEVGSVVGGKYRILHRVGRGGMSNVYLALNEKANKQWAVKEVRKDGGRDQDIIRQNLIAETSILKELRHPHLPSIIDIIQDDDTYLILMDYIEGITLLEKLDAEGAQSESDVVKWAMQICDVLGYLHSRVPPIIYRDTKPSNIMLKPNGDVVLIDFGTARVYKETAEEDTSWLGTRGYAAPEQYGGHGQTDERTDIYNLGATMYHLVTGHNPSRPPYEMYPIRKWVKTLSSGLESIILKCTKRNPDERYQSCAELMYDLEHYMELEEDYIKKQNKHMGMFILTCFLSVGCLVGGIGTRIEAGKMTNETYSNYIREAESATTEQAMLDGYKRAIQLSPEETQAYEEILDRIYLQDGEFRKEEAEQLIEILNTRNGNGTNEDYLMRNKAGYEELAYRLGLAYFYYYDGTGNKAMSQPWFGIARNGEYLDASKKERADRFYHIADYYSLLSNKDRAGDNTVSYSDYWKDLVSITKGNIVQEDNERTALVMYKELVYQMIMHANEFRRAGVKEYELRGAIENVENRISSDFDEVKMDTEELELLNALKDSVGSAKQAIDTSYGVENVSTDLEVGT